jgi:LemA protein
MKRIIAGVVIVVLLVLSIGLITGYNGLVDLDENISAKYSQIEVRLQERHDKIPQLVAAVNGLEQYALDVYTAITDARTAYANAENMDDLIEADAETADALSRLLVVVEDNPNINVTAAYTGLIDEISSMESALAVARRDYNLAVQEYNAAVRKFPRVLYASLFGFEKELDYWKMNDGADEVPEVNFD